MRRGGTLHPPIPRAPATTLQSPFLPSEAQVSVVGSGSEGEEGGGGGLQDAVLLQS